MELQRGTWWRRSLVIKWRAAWYLHERCLEWVLARAMGDENSMIFGIFSGR